MLLRLTRHQLNVLARLSLPLARANRRPFAELVLQRLQEQTMIGDGAFYRIVAECQKQFWTPPSSQLDKPAR